MTDNERKESGAARRALWLLALPALFLSTACQDAGITNEAPAPQLGVHANNASNGTPTFEELILCKEWTNASDISVDFDVTVDPDDNLTPPVASMMTRTLTDTGSSECRVVAFFANTATVGPADLTVVETVPTGATLVDIQVTTIVRDGATVGEYNPTPDPSTGTFTAVGADRRVGFVVTYTNQLEETGGEGCTPGYWKNHAGAFSHSQGGQKKPSAWQVFSPLDSYDGVFGVASSFGGNLIEALNRGGGGENALGRHATAALLNAAHSGVSYAFTTAQVIALVQGAYVSGDFTGAKDQLASENEQGCPL